MIKRQPTMETKMNLPSSNVPEIIPNSHVRPLRAVSKGGTTDRDLLDIRAADEIERLSNRVVELEEQLARYAKPELLSS